MSEVAVFLMYMITPIVVGVLDAMSNYINASKSVSKVEWSTSEFPNTITAHNYGILGTIQYHQPSHFEVEHIHKY